MSGLAEGSIRADLWNASYDSLLRLDMPEETRLIDYADDVAVLVAGRTGEQKTEKNRSSHLDQKKIPDPAFHIDRRVHYRVKTSG